MAWPPSECGSGRSRITICFCRLVFSVAVIPNHVANASDQHIRDSLASYEFGAPRKQTTTTSSNQTTPPLTSDTTTSTLSVESTWSLGGSKFPGARHLDWSAPQTRRSSMASNVHSLLNPAETVERDEEEALADDRKRKRIV